MSKRSITGSPSCARAKGRHIKPQRLNYPAHVEPRLSADVRVGSIDAKPLSIEWRNKPQRKQQPRNAKTKNLIVASATINSCLHALLLARSKRFRGDRQTGHPN